MVIIGIDYGKRRVGIAKSDELCMFGHGIGYIENTGHEQVLTAIKKYCDEFHATRIVIGLPRKMDGSLGESAEDVLSFVEILKMTVPFEVITWDERLTTKGASQYLLGSNLNGKKKREKIDQLAAQIILQGYLDSQRRGISDEEGV